MVHLTLTSSLCSYACVVVVGVCYPTLPCVSVLRCTSPWDYRGLLLDASRKRSCVYLSPPYPHQLLETVWA